MTYKQFIDFLYYKCLPPEWSKEDMNIYPVAPLYRYLQALIGYDYVQTSVDDEGNIKRQVTGHVDSGFETIIKGANNLNLITDPDKSPVSVFPYLFESFGIDYKSIVENKTDIDGNNIIYYQRKILNNIGELMRRRGTISGIRYLVRLLTGLDFIYEYERIKSKGTTVERRLTIHLLLKTVEDELNKEQSRKNIEQFLGLFVPHYITVVVGESKLYSEIDILHYGIKGTQTYSLNYDINSNVE